MNLQVYKFLKSEAEADKNKALARALSLGTNSKVLIFGTEGASDPEIYKQLVGRDAKDVK